MGLGHSVILHWDRQTELGGEMASSQGLWEYRDIDFPMRVLLTAKGGGLQGKARYQIHTAVDGELEAELGRC